MKVARYPYPLQGDWGAEGASADLLRKLSGERIAAGQVSGQARKRRQMRGFPQGHSDREPTYSVNRGFFSVPGDRVPYYNARL